MTEIENELSVIDVALEAIDQEMERLRQQQAPLLERRAAIHKARTLASYSLSIGDKLAINYQFRHYERVQFPPVDYERYDYLVLIGLTHNDLATIAGEDGRRLLDVPLTLCSQMKRRFQADQKRGLADENID